jgi:hypothetical protein
MSATAPAERPLWRPERESQIAACETLLASSIPAELRRAIREREQELSRERTAA